MGLLVCWWSEIASLDGGDVPGGGSDVGCWDNEKGDESGSVFNV